MNMNPKHHNQEKQRSASKLADLAMMMNRGRSQSPTPSLAQAPQQAMPMHNSSSVFTPVEQDMFRLALRREPQKAKEAFRQQAGTILAAINRVRSAPAERRAEVVAAEVQRFRAQGGVMDQTIEQVPLDKIDQLIDFLEQRAVGMLQLADEEDRVDQLERMIEMENRQEELPDSLNSGNGTETSEPPQSSSDEGSGADED